jgi:hypothetical protein
MEDNRPAWQSARRDWLAAILLIGGLALLAMSYVWPGRATRRANWSLEQARAYQAASEKLHSLSHESVHAIGTNDEKEVGEKLAQAKAEYDVLRCQLDSAIDRPKQVRLMLRVCGFALAAAGAAILYKGKRLPQIVGLQSN